MSVYSHQNSVQATLSVAAQRHDHAVVPILSWGLFASLFLMSLFDFYDFNRGAPFYTIAGTVLFIPCAVIAGRLWVKQDLMPPRQWVLSVTFLVIVTILSLLSVPLQGVAVQYKTPIAFLIGEGVLVLIFWASKSAAFTTALSRAIDLVTYAHLVAFFLQVGYFLFTGSYLDWVYLAVGEPSRYNPGGVIPLPRFTGLCVEPAHCAGLLFLFCSVRLKRNGFIGDRVTSALMLAIVMTLSVLGFFSLAALALVIALRTRRLSGFIALLATLALGGVVLWLQPDVQDYLFTRISNPLEDRSGQARLVSGLLDFIDLNWHYLWFGYGLGNAQLINSTFELLSGYIYLLFFFGLLGTAVFAASLFSLLRGTRWYSYSAVFMVLTLLGRPIFTTTLWWVWLGYLCLESMHTSVERHPLHVKKEIR